MNDKETISILKDIDLIDVYEHRNNLAFDSEDQRKEYLTTLFSEIVNRYVENVKYENGLTAEVPVDHIYNNEWGELSCLRCLIHIKQ